VPSAFIDTEPPLAVEIAPVTAVRVLPFLSVEFDNTVSAVCVCGAGGVRPTPKLVLPIAPV
jgi:hypothetical protein